MATESDPENQQRPQARSRAPAARWPDAVDDILAGDQAVAFAYVTPARGAVLLPLTNTGLRDRAAGTMTPVSTSVGMWGKLERVRAEPRVAIAYHAREHGFAEGPEYVLVQGRAEVSPLDRRDWVERHRDAWERFSGPRDVGPWERWLRAYHWRAGISLAVERITVWPDLACRGGRAVHGTRWPADDPPSQSPPARGTAPRVAHRRAARRARRRPHILLAWTGADGFPVVVPVSVEGADSRGILLSAAPDLVPPGGRRAGLLAHSFARYTAGQHQHRHTGWLEADGDDLVYAPHTHHGYWLPESVTLYRLGAGLVTRRGLRRARRAEFVSR